MRGPARPSTLASRAAAVLVLATGAAVPAFAQSRAQSRARVVATVRDAASGRPIADATVRALPSGRTCTTNRDGVCRLVVPAAPVGVRATAVGFVPDSQAVRARGDSLVASLALRRGAATLDRVVTTGTRAADRTVVGSAVPVDVLDASLLERTGVPEPWQQLQRLVPSVNVPHIPLGDNHARPVTLRGLAPHHALVLVNGRRRHPAALLLAGPAVPFAAYTDLAAIPAGAIERIEVLRDGAAAQYGSDAIGGVVNVVLRSDAHRELRTSLGRVASREGGRAFDDGRTFVASGTWGAVARGGAHAVVTAELRDREATNRAYPDRRAQYLPGDPRIGAEPRVSSAIGNGAARDGVVVLSAELPLPLGLDGYAFGGVARREGVSPDGFFRRPLDPRGVRAVHPDGFMPVLANRMDDASLASGVRGIARGWRWDAGVSWGGNRVAHRVRNSVNPSLGASSPTAFDAGAVVTQQWLATGDAARPVRVGAVPFDVAAGVELRLDRYRIVAGEPDSWRDGGARIPEGPRRGAPADVGAQGMVGYRPADVVSARRTGAALWVELEARPVSRVLLQAAARGERWSDFGGTTDGRVVGRVALARGLAARASLGTGFRAPSLTQQYHARSASVHNQVNGVTTVLTVRTFPVGTEEARVLGATDLRPETSVNRSAGVVLDLPGLPLVTADAYRIDLRDRIVLGQSVTDSAIVRLFADRGMRGIGGGNYFANALDSRTRGVDVVVTHAAALGRAGTLRLLGGYARNRTVVTRERPTAAPLARFGTPLLTRTGRGIVEVGQPRETVSLAAQHGVGAVELDLLMRRAGATAQLDRVNPAADQVVRARWIADARVAVRLQPRVQLAVSAANLLDAYPDEWFDFATADPTSSAPPGPSMVGIFRHPGGLSPFGMTGRTVQVQLTVR